MTGLPSNLKDRLNLARNPDDAGQQNLYFIGTFERRITFYSQQVRALHLAEALSRSCRLQAADRVAIVGAGAAGTTIALAIALIGCDVSLYDPAANVLQLQSASPRLLHPHIYEWPNLGSLNDLAGLPLLDWAADLGGQVCARLQADFSAAKTRLSNLRFHGGHKLTKIERVRSEWEITLQGATGPVVKQFRHVVLAMGFGEERSCGTSIPTDYWRPTGVGTNALEAHSGTSYLISGNGDGGLTELLSLLVSDFEHLSFTKEFLQMFPDDLLRIAAAPVFESCSPQQDLEPLLRSNLTPLLQKQGIIERLAQKLRRDRMVTINTGGVLFEAAKAAPLNQCMVFAVLEAAAAADLQILRTSGYITDVITVPGGQKVVGIERDGVAVDNTFDHVILRHGPDRASRYKPTGAIFEAYESYIAELLRTRPELAEPPSLEADCYHFFENISIPKLNDAPQKAVLLAQAQQRDITIILGVDAASQILVERGKLKLSDVAFNCERLSHTVIVELDFDPARTPFARDIVRLARASGGRVHLKASADRHSAWSAFWNMVALSPSTSTFEIATQVEMQELSCYIDTCLLRLLDGGMQGIIASGSCPLIGIVHAQTLSQVQGAWPLWRTQLNSDPGLRADFLRWLVNVDQQEISPWDGDHGRLDDLTSALLMILATHSGQVLSPASAERGNLSFSQDAIGLGSGCRTVRSVPIATWTDPEQWGVDALILSSSSEIDMASGTILDAGIGNKGIMHARRVPPAIIQNNRYWRTKLSESLGMWKAAVSQEFKDYRDRQDLAFKEVSQ